MSGRKSVETSRVFELPEDSSSSDEEEQEEGPSPPTTLKRKYNKTGMYTKEAMAQRRAEKMAERKQTATAMKYQEPEEPEVPEEAGESAGDSEQEVHIVVRSPVKPGKLKRPTHRRTTME